MSRFKLIATNTDEEITDSYVYDAFGIVINQTGTTENNYLYTGEQYDPNVGFYYLRARYYNPENGRFMTHDPRWGNPFEPMSLHKYLYANANPMLFVDPSGEVAILLYIIKVAVATMFASVLSSVLYVAGPYWLASGIKTPVEWTSESMWVQTVGYVLGGGEIFVSLESQCLDNKYGKGTYSLLMVGLTFSLLRLPVGFSLSEMTIKTPAVCGTNTSALTGFSVWGAATHAAGPIGVVYTMMTMGKGFGFIGWDVAKGLSVPMEAMLGWSFRRSWQDDIPCPSGKT